MAINAEDYDGLSPKQIQRLKDQKEREEKKKLKRQAKAEQRERRALEKELKLEARERRNEEELEALGYGMSAKEIEEQKRLEEERELFEKEEHQQPTITKHHTKKSAFDSNRLGIVVQ
jgi:hypothetical protein